MRVDFDKLKGDRTRWYQRAVEAERMIITLQDQIREMERKGGVLQVLTATAEPHVGFMAFGSSMFY